VYRYDDVDQGRHWQEGTIRHRLAAISST
jgi:hypothetical protein